MSDRRLASAAALVALVLSGCSGKDGGKKSGDSGATNEPAVKPPVACPVGKLTTTQSQIDAELALVDAWNEIRLSDAICSDATGNDPVNALEADEALMWTARCWALDVATNGQPPAPDQFSDGTTLNEAALAQGFQGIVNGWSLVGGLQSEDKALDTWLQGNPDACHSLWGDAAWGALAWAKAGDGVIVARLTGL